MDLTGSVTAASEPSTLAVADLDPTGQATYTFSLRATDAYGTQMRAREADDTIVIDHEDSLDTQTGRERDILRRAESGDYS